LGAVLLLLLSVPSVHDEQQDITLFQRSVGTVVMHPRLQRLQGLRTQRLRGQTMLVDEICEELRASEEQMQQLCPECNCGCCKEQNQEQTAGAEDVRAYYLGTNPGVFVTGQPGIAIEPEEGSGFQPIKTVSSVGPRLDGTSRVDPLEWYKMEYRHDPYLSKYWDKSPWASESYLTPVQYTVTGGPTETVIDPEEFEAAIEAINAREAAKVATVNQPVESMSPEEMEAAVKDYKAKIEEIESMQSAGPQEDEEDGAWMENASYGAAVQNLSLLNPCIQT